MAITAPVFGITKMPRAGECHKCHEPKNATNRTAASVAFFHSVRGIFRLSDLWHLSVAFDWRRSDSRHPVKILFTADLHLLRATQEHTLAILASWVHEIGPEVMVVAGDLA